MTDAEIDYLFNIFLQIDRDESGEIDVGEFYGYFDLERTEYTDRVYETMGECVTVCKRVLEGFVLLSRAEDRGVQTWTAQAKWTFTSLVRAVIRGVFCSLLNVQLPVEPSCVDVRARLGGCRRCDPVPYRRCPLCAVLFIWFTASMDVRTLPDFVFTLYDTDKDGLLYKVSSRLRR